MKSLRLFLNFWSMIALAFCALASAMLLVAPASAQAPVPDMTQFGYPRVTGTAMFTPGEAVTLTAGNQKVELPADFISKTVKFEFLEGDPSFFAANLGAQQGMDVVATFAFRVTDEATGQLLARFDKPVQWSITDPRITSDSKVFNTSAENPPKVTPNAAPGTVDGNTLSHPFGGASVGWLVLNPAAAAPTPGVTATTVEIAPPTEVATVSPTEEATPVVAGMPSTGRTADAALNNSALVLLVVLLMGAFFVMSGIALGVHSRSGR